MTYRVEADAATLGPSKKHCYAWAAVRVAAGVLYVPFCWTLIPALIAFIEALLLFGMTDADFARKHPG